VTSPLRPGDHRTLGKLCNEILPWVIGGYLLKKQWFVRVASGYGYARDVGAVVAGLGFGPGIFGLLQGKSSGNQNAFDVLRSSFPPQWFIPGVIGLCVYVVMRVVVSQQDVVARALLAKEYARSINASYFELTRALAKPSPMADIENWQRSIDDRVQDAIKNDVWPFDPPAPRGPFVDKQLAIMVDEIREKFMPFWDPPPMGEQHL
jgi:hypothetical protein